MKFEGIYTPLVAPFFDDFTLNHDAMQQTVDLLGTQVCTALLWRVQRVNITRCR